MRTTVRLDDELLLEVKLAAARSGRTLTAFIEDALRAALAAPAPEERPRPFVLRTFGGELQPGVDLDDTAALVELMDQEKFDRLYRPSTDQDATG